VHRTRARRLCLALVGLPAAAVVLLASSAGAHAIVRDTGPGADQVVASSPERVVMRFNEPVEVAFGAIRVFDTNGQRVDRGRARHLPDDSHGVQVALEQDLPDGTYTVTWRVVSADGHPINEAFVFHVGAPGERPQGIAEQIVSGQSGAGRMEDALAGAARWATFGGLLVLGGAMGFLLFVWRPGRVAARPAAVENRFLRRWRTVLFVSWGVVLAASAAAYALQGAVAGDLPFADALSLDVLREVAWTRFGEVTLLRFGLLGATLAAAAAVSGRLQPNLGKSGGAAVAAPALPRWAVGALGVLTVALLATPGLAGHAGSTSPVVLNVGGDVLHMVAAAAWVGGLVVLLVGAFPAARAAPAGDSQAALAPVVARFSDLALVAVGVLVASGLLRSWAEVRALRALSEPYGVVLLVKLALFLPLVGLGVFNNRWLKPHIREVGERGGRALATLRRAVLGEVALAVLVVAVTALLVNLAPARVAAGVEGPFITDVRLGEHRLNVLVDPNQVGENEVHLTATQSSGAPAPVEEMWVLFRMPDQRIGPLVGEGVRLAPGHYVVQGRQLSVAGRWLLEIVARTGRFDEERARLTVLVN
jgi:copper transport protein